MAYLRSLFGGFCRDEDDVEVRCLVFYSLWIGSHFIAADHGARSRADVLKLALGRAIAFTSAAAARLYPRPDLAYVPLAGAAPCTVALAWDPERPPTVLASLLAAARRARDQARADGSFERYSWR